LSAIILFQCQETEICHGKNSWNQHWRFDFARGDRGNFILIRTTAQRTAICVSFLTVTVLSHRVKRITTLKQNYLLGARFDVCVQMLNKALAK